MVVKLHTNFTSFKVEKNVGHPAETHACDAMTYQQVTQMKNAHKKLTTIHGS